MPSGCPIYLAWPHSMSSLTLTRCYKSDINGERRLELIMTTSALSTEVRPDSLHGTLS